MLGYHTPPWQGDPPGKADPTLGKADPPGKADAPLLSRQTPRQGDPPAQCMLGDTVNKWAVCILLECNSCSHFRSVANRKWRGRPPAVRHLFPSAASGGQASTTNTHMNVASPSGMFDAFTMPSFGGLFGGTPVGNRSARQLLPPPTPGGSTVSLFCDEDMDGRFSIHFW